MIKTLKFTFKFFLILILLIFFVFVVLNIFNIPIKKNLILGPLKYSNKFINSGKSYDSPFTINRFISDVETIGFIYSFKKLIHLKILGYRRCDIPKTNFKKLKIGKHHASDIVAGHIYVNFEMIKNLIDLDIRFNNLFLNGDVFEVPSFDNWNKLDNLLKNSNFNNYFIIPGNHDLSGNKINTMHLSEIFFEKYKYKFPLVLNTSNKIYILNNSNIRPLNLTDELIGLINEISPENYGKDLIILSHHLLRPYPKSLSNGASNIKSNFLEDFNFIEKKLNKFRNTYFINGDTGSNNFTNYYKDNNIIPYAFDCIKKNNVFFLSSGFAGHYNDEMILITKNGNIYRLNKN